VEALGPSLDDYMSITMEANRDVLNLEDLSSDTVTDLRNLNYLK